MQHDAPWSSPAWLTCKALDHHGFHVFVVDTWPTICIYMVFMYFALWICNPYGLCDFFGHLMDYVTCMDIWWTMWLVWTFDELCDFYGHLMIYFVVIYVVMMIWWHRLWWYGDIWWYMMIFVSVLNCYIYIALHAGIKRKINRKKHWACPVRRA
jgi:hypothetical protein